MLRPTRCTRASSVTLDPRLHEFLRFAAVGVVGFIVDTAALTFALKVLHLDLYTGRVFSYLVAATSTWALNRRFTFIEAVPSPPLRQWAKFMGANALGGAVNYAVYAALVTFTPWARQFPVSGVAAGAVAGLFFNFAVNKFWVFRRRSV